MNDPLNGAPSITEVVAIDLTGDVDSAKGTSSGFADDCADYLALNRIDLRWLLVVRPWFSHSSQS